ncbi:MAG: TonB-dependent receptor [Kofleriaceae bacterium]|nr:TonB-dependent receptor [Kofleriaceae bacterium]
MTRTGLTCLLVAYSATAAAEDAAAPASSAPPPRTAQAEGATVGEEETIVIIDRAPDPDARTTARDRERALGDAPFVTIIHSEDHPATASVADAVGATVGAQTRSLGGFGAYESVSVRGTAPGHTAVLVDGVPLARLAAVTQDLGRYTLDSFSEVELYRGAVPVELGGAGIGGALNLVTRLGRGEAGERVRASAGIGSFGARHVRLHYGDRHGERLESATTIGYQAARGDFSYYSDNGTPLNLTDDTYQQRENNEFWQVDGASRVGLVDRSAVGGVRIGYKQQGLSGSYTQPNMAANMATLDVIGDGRFEASVGSAIARQFGYVLVEHELLRDPEGKLGGGPQDRKYLTLSGGVSTTWRAPIGATQLSAGIELRGDKFTDTDRSGRNPGASGDREGGAALAGLDIALGETIVVTPAVRLDVQRTAPAALVFASMANPVLPTRWDTLPSPRLTARALVMGDVSVKTSAGSYVRLPTLAELFGNRGTIIGSPEIRPERGQSADAGFVWAPAKALGVVDRIFVEASAFGTRARDRIVFVPSFGQVARALNVADSQTYGAELVASARLARTVSLTANYTRLVTQQLSDDPNRADKALPRQPAHAVYARVDVVRRAFGRRASAWLDGSWQSETFLDEANFMRVPPRLLVGTGARVELAAGVAASIAIQNLADARIQYLPLDPPPRPDFTETPTALTDVAGFPLPGRTVYVALDWSH